MVKHEPELHTSMVSTVAVSVAVEADLMVTVDE
jgi:hypothetical protein